MVRGQVAVSACTEVVTGVRVTLYDELLLNEMGSATTGADGEFSIPLPAPGRYVLTATKGVYNGASGVFDVGDRCPYQVVLLQ